MRKILKKFLPLSLVLALLCPPALAADTPVLWMDGGNRTGNVRLTLERLGDQEVNSVQLELTLSGSYPNADFTLNGGISGQYSQCRTEQLSGQTRITLYIDSMKTLNHGGKASLGTLTLGYGCKAPSSAQLTILNRGLETSGISTIPVRSTSDSSSGSSSSGSSSSGNNSSGNSSSSETVKPADPVVLPFTDVQEDMWYYSAVQYVYAQGLMAGTTTSTFSPDMSTSRGMIVTILHRLSGSPAGGSSNFTDVATDMYYADAVAWAAANGVVSGYGDGRFGPNDPITREQAAVILRGYARLNGKSVSAQADLSGFTDAGQISPFALEAMRWAHAEGLINGTSSSTLTPGGTATRAQAAVLLRGFCENIIFDH